MKLNERELAAILGGLRLLQAHPCPLDSYIHAIVTNGDSFERLDDDEIDELCERLNLEE